MVWYNMKMFGKDTGSHGGQCADRRDGYVGDGLYM